MFEKNIIETFINNNAQIQKLIANTKQTDESADEILPNYIEALKQFRYNSVLGTYFARLLQLSNKEEFFSKYELSDISALYESLIDLEEFNLDIYTDAANFENSVMDDSKKARKYISDGIVKGKLKIEELERLLQELEPLQ